MEIAGRLVEAGLLMKVRFVDPQIPFRISIRQRKAVPGIPFFAVGREC